MDLLRQTAVVSGGMGVRPAEVVLCGDSLLRGACVRGLFDLWLVLLRGFISSVQFRRNLQKIFIVLRHSYDYNMKLMRWREQQETSVSEDDAQKHKKSGQYMSPAPCF